MEARQAGSLALGMLLAPGRTLDRIAAAPAVGAAALAVVSAGALWSVLCICLWSGGHGPSHALVPIPRADYYLAQAAWVIPALLVGWAIVAGSSHFMARRGGGLGTFRATLACTGFAYAVPLAWLLVVPDIAAYLLFGFGMLGKVVRVTGPLTLVAQWALCARALVAAHQLAWARAVPVALLALLAQAAVVSPILR